MGCGNCTGCSGCGELTLNEGELHVLRALSQIPFLPVARTAADPSPLYFADAVYPQREYSLILQCLEKKQLISIDLDTPLKGCTDAQYLALPIRGSAALTARGQEVLQLLEIQGFSE